jgi:predicted esterase
MTDIGETRIEVRRTARLATIGEPGPSVREVWIACHGFGQLAPRFARRLLAIASPDRYIVAPEALNRYYLQGSSGSDPTARIGATWMTREDREYEIADYVAYLDRVHETIFRQVPADARVIALGFSQGVATIARWAARTAAAVNALSLSNRQHACPPRGADGASRIPDARMETSLSDV